MSMTVYEYLLMSIIVMLDISTINIINILLKPCVSLVKCQPLEATASEPGQSRLPVVAMGTLGPVGQKIPCGYDAKGNIQCNTCMWGYTIYSQL